MQPERRCISSREQPVQILQLNGKIIKESGDNGAGKLAVSHQPSQQRLLIECAFNWFSYGLRERLRKSAGSSYSHPPIKHLCQLRQFQRLRERLDEVGRNPSAETEELELAILQQRPELEWTGPESITY